MPKRHGTRPLGPAIRILVATLKPPLTVLTHRDWQGEEYLRDVYPPTDGIVVVSNHLSHLDPLVLMHFLWDNGRTPRFLTKEALFNVPVLGWIPSNGGQIRVFRETSNAADSVRDAVAAVKDGEAVVVYPEGTITRDPDLWPMTGKTGAARIALLSGCPVIPVAQWGANDVMAPYVKEFKVFPPKTIRMRVGPPVDLDDLRGKPLSAEVLEEATERIMDELTAQLELIRGEKAPAERMDYREWRAAQKTENEES